MKNLVVGAGLTGAVIAERIASKLHEEVVVIDKASHVGGAHYDYIDKNTGILIQPKHANFLHTDKKYVWDYLSDFSKMICSTFSPTVEIQGNYTSMPLCLDVFREVFPDDFGKMLENKLIAKFGYNKKITLADMHRNFDDDLKFLADYFYENVYKPYTMKLWGISEDEVPACEDSYFPFFISNDSRYYKDKYQAVPQNGWTAMIENILKHKNIKLKLNTEFSEINTDKFDRIFFTGSIDEYFDYKHGELPYRSVRVEIDTNYNNMYGQTCNFPISYDFLRRVCYTNIPRIALGTSSEIIGFEYIEPFELGKNERFYPIQNAKSQEILQKYLQEASELSKVYFVGKLGEFKYYESDELVTRAFETVASLMIKNTEPEEETENEIELENANE